MQEPPEAIAELDDTSADSAGTRAGGAHSAVFEVRDAVRVLPLEDKVRLLTGSTPWVLFPLPALGLDSIVVSDGPIGVRGVDEDQTPSAQLPSPSAIAATWNVELTSRLGTLVAREALRKHTDVVLAPVVNLQRSPVGGRHFECYSEDPLLTGHIAAAFVAAAQSEGVGMCVKHFVGNEVETDRTTFTAMIDERTLREVYLAPFEMVVREAKVWSVMAAYNRVDDGTESAPATEHSHLVNDILKGEWGFDGVVVSDWLATNTTEASALGGLDLVMPGPGGPWEDALLTAVRDGRVSEQVIDDKVERIVRLGERVGAIGRTASALPGVGDAPAGIPSDLYATAETRSLLRESVARSIVVLSNRDEMLPLRATELRSVALIGSNALEPFVQGGGSAFVRAPYFSDPASALREALPGVDIVVERGGSGRTHAPFIEPELVSTPSGALGYELTLFDERGTALGDPVVVDANEGWNRHVPAVAVSALIRARVRLSPGQHRLEVGLSGRHRVRFDDELVSESDRIAGSDVILDSSANHPDGPARSFQVEDEDLIVAIEANLQVVHADGYGTFVRFALRHEADSIGTEAEIERAVAAAASADIAVVIVGTNEETESEGWDRPNLDLPASQNELVRRVSEANPRTVVVINAGAPVILPWLEDVAAVLWWWLPGQEAGNGLADALIGVTEPSGRLPWTLPASLEDAPVPHGLPVDGVVDYAEGVHVGHRGWDKLERTPARPFGYGEGYAAWSYETIRASGWLPGGEEFAVEVDVSNVGARQSRETVQLYLEDPSDTVDRPVRWLAGFASVDAGAGASASVLVRIPRRSFETWDVASHRWIFAAGSYVVRAGHTSRDLPLRVIVDVTAPADPGSPTR